MLAPEVRQENRRWLDDLAATGPVREFACRNLYSLLLQVARRETARRARSLEWSGPELEDIAHQSAGDALMAINKRLDRFRGESRFTTWAIKFVIFDVSSKINRHFWRHRDIAYEQDDWSQVASCLDALPDEEVQAHELVETVSAAIRQDLSEHQRFVFVAAVLDGIPINVVAARLGCTSNALYKVLFDARKKLRIALVAAGHLPQ